MDHIANTTEYQIYIGCNDGHTHNELISEDELRKIVNSFFKEKRTDFSMVSLKGGFLHYDGSYVIENTLCVNIITDNEERVLSLVNNLSMFMNQESALIVKHNLSAEYR